METATLMYSSTAVALLGSALCALLVWLVWRRVRQTARLPLRGRRVLLSGCDSGIGRAAALHLAARGAIVYAGCLTEQGRVELQREADEEAAVAAAAAAGAAGHQSAGVAVRSSSLHALRLDVTSDESVAALLVEVERLSHSAGLDVLLNIAGVMSPASLVELTPLRSFQRNLDVNFLGAVRMTQTFLPLLRRKAAGDGGDGGGGVTSSPRVINVTSFLGRVAPFSLSAYSSSKFALEALSASLRSEQRASGVSVCVIQPGTTRTALGSHMREGMERCWRVASAAERQRLGPSYLTAMRRGSALFDLFGRDVSCLMWEVEHAVCARWPYDRYVCGWDSFLFGQLLPLLPAWICDTGCLLVLGWPRPAAKATTTSTAPSSAAPPSLATEELLDASADVGTVPEQPVSDNIVQRRGRSIS